MPTGADHRFPAAQLTSTGPGRGSYLAIGGEEKGVIGPAQRSPGGRHRHRRARSCSTPPPGPLKLRDGRTQAHLRPGPFTRRPSSSVSCTFKGPGPRDRWLQQIRRVLKPGGRLLIWDVNFRSRPPEKKYALFRYTAQLPGKQVSSGYGSAGRKGVQDLGYWFALGRRRGRGGRQEGRGRLVLLELTKPGADLGEAGVVEDASVEAEDLPPPSSARRSPRMDERTPACLHRGPRRRAASTSASPGASSGGRRTRCRPTGVRGGDHDLDGFLPPSRGARPPDVPSLLVGVPAGCVAEPERRASPAAGRTASPSCADT